MSPCGPLQWKLLSCQVRDHAHGTTHRNANICCVLVCHKRWWIGATTSLLPRCQPRTVSSQHPHACTTTALNPALASTRLLGTVEAGGSHWTRAGLTGMCERHCLGGRHGQLGQERQEVACSLYMDSRVSSVQHQTEAIAPSDADGCRPPVTFLRLSLPVLLLQTQMPRAQAVDPIQLARSRPTMNERMVNGQLNAVATS